MLFFPLPVSLMPTTSCALLLYPSPMRRAFVYGRCAMGLHGESISMLDRAILKLSRPISPPYSAFPNLGTLGLGIVLQLGAVHSRPGWPYFGSIIILYLLSGGSECVP